MAEILTAAQRVVLARHIARPGTADFIAALFTDFFIFLFLSKGTLFFGFLFFLCILFFGCAFCTKKTLNKSRDLFRRS